MPWDRLLQLPLAKAVRGKPLCVPGLQVVWQPRENEFCALMRMSAKPLNDWHCEKEGLAGLVYCIRQACTLHKIIKENFPEPIDFL